MIVCSQSDVYQIILLFFLNQTYEETFSYKEDKAEKKSKKIIHQGKNLHYSKVLGPSISN